MRTSLAIGSLLALPLLAALEPEETYLLVPRFEDGMALDVDFSYGAEFELDEASVTLDGVDLLGDAAWADCRLDGSLDIEELVQSTKDGAIRRALVTLTDLSTEYELSMEVLGKSQDLQQQMPWGDQVGRTYEVTVADDGQVSAEEVSVTGEVAPIDSTAPRVEPGVRNHFEGLLPERPVAIGDSWELGDEFLHTVLSGFRGPSVMGGLESEMKALAELVDEHGKFKVTGVLDRVEDDVAEIAWTIEFTIKIDDLAASLEDLLPEGRLDQIPPDAELGANVLCILIGKGNGSFDLSMNQLIDFSFHAAFSVDFNLSVSSKDFELAGRTASSGIAGAWGGVCTRE